jgi:hypothetical protein
MKNICQRLPKNNFWRHLAPLPQSVHQSSRPSPPPALIYTIGVQWFEHFTISTFSWLQNLFLRPVWWKTHLFILSHWAHLTSQFPQNAKNDIIFFLFSRSIKRVSKDAEFKSVEKVAKSSPNNFSSLKKWFPHFYDCSSKFLAGGNFCEAKFFTITYFLKSILNIIQLAFFSTFWTLKPNALKMDWKGKNAIHKCISDLILASIFASIFSIFLTSKSIHIVWDIQRFCHLSLTC